MYEPWKMLKNLVIFWVEHTTRWMLLQKYKVSHLYLWTATVLLGDVSIPTGYTFLRTSASSAFFFHCSESFVGSFAVREICQCLSMATEGSISKSIPTVEISRDEQVEWLSNRRTICETYFGHSWCFSAKNKRKRRGMSEWGRSTGELLGWNGVQRRNFRLYRASKLQNFLKVNWGPLPVKIKIFTPRCCKYWDSKHLMIAARKQ